MTVLLIMLRREVASLICFFEGVIQVVGVRDRQVLLPGGKPVRGLAWPLVMADHF